MEEIIETLKKQQFVIGQLRRGLNQVYAEPKETTEYFNMMETLYSNALIKCGALASKLGKPTNIWHCESDNYDGWIVTDGLKEFLSPNQRTCRVAGF